IFLNISSRSRAIAILLFKVDIMMSEFNNGLNKMMLAMEARTAWEWWQRSREAINIKLPKKNIGWDKDEEDCWNNAIDACIAAIHAAGLKPRNG
uniref:hypothetical protein n=2 Tax=Yersinia enterocolitica TaxID=630 RepID=UPI001C8EDC1A